MCLFITYIPINSQFIIESFNMRIFLLFFTKLTFALFLITHSNYAWDELFHDSNFLDNLFQDDLQENPFDLSDENSLTSDVNTNVTDLQAENRNENRFFDPISFFLDSLIFLEPEEHLKETPVAVQTPLVSVETTDIPHEAPSIILQAPSVAFQAPLPAPLQVFSYQRQIQENFVFVPLDNRYQNGLTLKLLRANLPLLHQTNISASDSYRLQYLEEAEREERRREERRKKDRERYAKKQEELTEVEKENCRKKYRERHAKNKEERNRQARERYANRTEEEKAKSRTREQKRYVKKLAEKRTSSANNASDGEDIQNKRRRK